MKPATRSWFLAAAVLALCGCPGSTGGPAPGVTLTPTTMTLSLEQFPEGTARVPFMVTNDSAAAVSMAGATANCGCVVVNAGAGRSIAPGERLRLDVVAQLGGVEDRVVDLNVVVQGAEGRLPLSAQLILKGRPLRTPALARLPEAVEIHAKPNVRMVERQFGVSTFEPVGSAPWLIPRQFQSAGLEVTCSLHSEKESARGVVERTYVMTAQVNQTQAAPGEWFWRPATAKATEETLPVVRLILRPWRPLRAMPEQLVVALERSANGPIRRRISLLVEEQALAATIVGASADADWITIRPVAPRQPPTATGLLCQYDVLIDAPAALNAAGQVLESRIRIQTDEPSLPAIEVPVMVVQRDGPDSAPGVSAP